MPSHLRAEYLRLRAKGFRAAEALRAAHINTAFAGMATLGKVRLEVRHDDDNEYEPADGLTKREREALRRRMREEGTWGIVAEVRCKCCGTWKHADAVWGFVGDDWQDSMYDVDIKSEALRKIMEEQQVLN